MKVEPNSHHSHRLAETSRCQVVVKMWNDKPSLKYTAGSMIFFNCYKKYFFQVNLRMHALLSCIGKGNGTPLQCSCLENPRDRGAWWAAVYGVAQSWTRLSDLAAAAAAVLSEVPLPTIHPRVVAHNSLRPNVFF